jgi:hypothetical protein
LPSRTNALAKLKFPSPTMSVDMPSCPFASTVGFQKVSRHFQLTYSQERYSTERHKTTCHMWFYLCHKTTYQRWRRMLENGPQTHRARVIWEQQLCARFSATATPDLSKSIVCSTRLCCPTAKVSFATCRSDDSPRPPRNYLEKKTMCSKQV